MSKSAKQALETSENARNGLGDLLHAIGEELHVLACEIVALGEHFSRDVGPETSAERMRALQAFDTLGQQALAQSRLLSGVERCMAGREDKKSVVELIAGVPVHAVRNRLMAIATGHISAVVRHGAEADGDIDWF